MKRIKEQPFSLAAPALRSFLRKYGATVSYLQSHGVARSSIMAFRRGDIVSMDTFVRIVAAVRRLAVVDGTPSERREFHRDITALFELLIKLSNISH